MGNKISLAMGTSLLFHLGPLLSRWNHKNNRNKKKLYEIKIRKGGRRNAFLGFKEKA